MNAQLSDQQKAQKAAQNKGLLSFDSNINVDALPVPVRDFIRLQHEITGRDVGQNPFFFPKETTNSFSQIDTQKVEKERKKRRQWWYEFLLVQIKLYSQIFAKTWLKIEMAEKQIEIMEEQLDEMESLHGLPFTKASSGIREKINAVKEELYDYKEQLLSKPEPTEAGMIKMQEKIDQRMEKLERYFENFNAIRKKAQNLIVAGSAYSYFSILKFFERKKDEGHPLDKIDASMPASLPLAEPVKIKIDAASENDNSPAH